jgi:protein disulfide-isomerase A1
LQSAQKIFGGEVKNHILLFLKKEGGEDTIEQFRTAASDFKGKASTNFIEKEKY